MFHRVAQSPIYAPRTPIVAQGAPPSWREAALEMPAMPEPAQQGALRRSVDVACVDELVPLYLPDHDRIDAHAVAAQNIGEHLVADDGGRRGRRSHRVEGAAEAALARLARQAHIRAAQPRRDP